MYVINSCIIVYLTETIVIKGAPGLWDVSTSPFTSNKLTIDY